MAEAHIVDPTVDSEEPVEKRIQWRSLRQQLLADNPRTYLLITLSDLPRALISHLTSFLLVSLLYNLSSNTPPIIPILSYFFCYKYLNAYLTAPPSPEHFILCCRWCARGEYYKRSGCVCYRTWAVGLVPIAWVGFGYVRKFTKPFLRPALDLLVQKSLETSQELVETLPKPAATWTISITYKQLAIVAYLAVVVWCVVANGPSSRHERDTKSVEKVAEEERPKRRCYALAH